MIADYKKKTDEELIAIVNKYMENYPNASRNHIILHAHGNHQRIRDLDKKGLIKLPKALPKGTGSSWGKYFYIDSRNKTFIR
jgi:hypothetical protein